MKQTNGSCSKQDKITFIPISVLNWYIVYETNLWPEYGSADFALEKSLFGAFKY